MVMTVMSVATPIVSPSMVSEARILCARRALKHWARLSRTASMGAEKASAATLPNPSKVKCALAEDDWILSERIRREAGGSYICSADFRFYLLVAVEEVDPCPKALLL